MMYKEKNRGLRRLRGLVLGLAPVMALAVVNIPAVASAISGLGEASLESPAESMAAVTVDKVSENPSNSESAKAETKAVEAEQMATYPGGEQEMFRYLAMNVNYPPSAMEKNIQGRSVIGFTVEADGSLSDFKVVKSAGAVLDQEATRVIASMPKWNPARKGGVAVASKYVLPVEFKLTGTEEKKAENVEAEDDAKVLDEVKVVGYGTSKKNSDKTETTAIVKIVNKDLSGPSEADVAIFVDGKRISSQEELQKINADKIKSIEVRKDQKDYPGGAIYVTMQK